MALTKDNFHEMFFDDLKDEEQRFFKDLLKHIFIKEAEKRIKIETILKKVKKRKENDEWTRKKTKSNG